MHQVMKNHILLSQTRTTDRENQWQPRKQNSPRQVSHIHLGYMAKPLRTPSSWYPHAHAQTHTTSALPMLEHCLSSVRSQGHQWLALLPALQLLHWLHLLHRTRQNEQLVLHPMKTCRALGPKGWPYSVWKSTSEVENAQCDSAKWLYNPMVVQSCRSTCSARGLAMLPHHPQVS